MAFVRLAIAFLAGAPMAPPVAAQETGCVQRDGSPAQVVAVDGRAELVLADGRVVRIAGIDVVRATAADPKLADSPRRALATWLAGHPVTLHALVPSADRWGRLVADVFAPADFSAPDDAPVSAAWMLVDAGLARTRPSIERDPCTPALIAAEDAARRARLGLWQDPDHAVIAADDDTALARHAGRFVLVEGEVVRVGNGRTRTFIDFGRGRGSFTVVVAKRARERIEAAGQALHDLQGVRLRVRGILDTRFGPRIEVAGPQDIERL